MIQEPPWKGRCQGSAPTTLHPSTKVVPSLSVLCMGFHIRFHLKKVFCYKKYCCQHPDTVSAMAPRQMSKKTSNVLDSLCLGRLPILRVRWLFEWMCAHACLCVHAHSLHYFITILFQHDTIFSNSGYPNNWPLLILQNMH